MERLLSKPAFRIRSFLIRPGYELADMGLPYASVFVVDASSNSITTSALMEQILASYPRSKILLTKETLKDEKVFPYLRIGAKGVVRYVDLRRNLARAVNAVAHGDFWLSREQLIRFIDWVLSTDRPMRLTTQGQLSRRERQVTAAVLQGLSNKEISSRLNISESTVKFHVSRILRKYGARKRSDLITKQSQQWLIAS
jgi:DNA-binding NarL/FixJ family response regulator